jgi:hypothetical protein
MYTTIFSSSFYTQCQPLFSFAKFRPKAKLKIQKLCDFESFQPPKVREKIVKMLDFFKDLLTGSEIGYELFYREFSVKTIADF